MDATDSDLTEDDSVLPTGGGGGNICLGGAEDLAVATDEAVDRIEDLLVFWCREENPVGCVEW
eukprot:CAMPEP_0178510988 /NCGR_PEP_ID=MMETSP0696-20121128/22129_1 /TAXON_ID=265572 /ORGANISM="Extubocellulus spinifer, Strain CCMP396" /LENGTH=62 /DNA_ID=CAMNT_0020140745 /DNA_START=387 /DNA_END=572 /DNA_ORIENTATION=-